MKPKAAILFTSGTNCDYETALAFNLAGGSSEIVLTKELKSKKLKDYQVIIIPGGFSYGDHFGSATIWANELKTVFQDRVSKFIDEGKLVLGVCNGFQVLVKLGFLPNTLKRNDPESVLANNSSGKFESRWVKVKVNAKSPLVFTKDIDILDMPVAHGEGNFMPKDIKTFGEMIKNNQIVLQYVDNSGFTTSEYPRNPSGSFAAIAGICDTTGRVFGLMPHPERFIFPNQNIKSYRQNAVTGLSIYKNAVDYFK
ncbi:MAG: phosphoribosylformylglycinamidine synthase I [Candidatus Woykebacteria bacterium]